MDRHSFRVWILTGGALFSSAALTGEATPLDAAVQASIRQAFCPQPKPAPNTAVVTPATPMDPAIEPSRVFDNLYFVGDRTTSAWALITSAGIILIDAGFHHNVEGTIVGGMKKLGLDPASIRYVIVSHGHNDHFGGAKFLQATYGARIVMSEADWAHMVSWPQRGSPAPFPQKDIVAKDGDYIRLGDTQVRIAITPGHTPGTISPLFDVRDGAARHRVGYWGGDGAGHLPPEGIREYAAAAQAWMALDPTVDVPLSNHVVADGTVPKLALLRSRASGAEHPFVTGNAGFRRWAGTLRDCATAFLP